MIRIVTKAELNELVQYPDGQSKYKPCGLFLSHECGKWVACDNSKGDAWTEEFDALEDAIDWLNSDGTKEEFEEMKRKRKQEAHERIPVVRKPRGQEPQDSKNPLDTPVTKRDLLYLAWCMYYSNTLTLPAYSRFEPKMKGESNA